MKIALIIVSLIVVFFIVRFVMLGQESQKMKVELGVVNGALTACKSDGNCAISGGSDKDLTAINVDANPIANLESILKEMGHEIDKKEENYIHALFKSSLFGFVDDVEFYYDGVKLHFRSSSRVGKSDLGVNKKRLIAILEKLK